MAPFLKIWVSIVYKSLFIFHTECTPLPLETNSSRNELQFLPSGVFSAKVIFTPWIGSIRFSLLRHVPKLINRQPFFPWSGGKILKKMVAYGQFCCSVHKTRLGRQQLIGGKKWLSIYLISLLTLVCSTTRGKATAAAFDLVVTKKTAMMNSIIGDGP